MAHAMISERMHVYRKRDLGLCHSGVLALNAHARISERMHVYRKRDLGLCHSGGLALNAHVGFQNGLNKPQYHGASDPRDLLLVSTCL